MCWICALSTDGDQTRRLPRCRSLPKLYLDSTLDHSSLLSLSLSMVYTNEAWTVFTFGVYLYARVTAARVPSWRRWCHLSALPTVRHQRAGPPLSIANSCRWNQIHAAILLPVLFPNGFCLGTFPLEIRMRSPLYVAGARSLTLSAAISTLHQRFLQSNTCWLVCHWVEDNSFTPL